MCFLRFSEFFCIDFKGCEEEGVEGALRGSPLLFVCWVKKCVVVVVKGTEGSGHTGNVFVDGLIKDIRPQCVKCLSFPPVFETLRVSNYARKNHRRQPRYVPKSENNFSRSTAMLLASLLSWH